MGWLDAPVIVLVALQPIYAGITLLATAAFSEGLKPMVYLVYRLGIATLLVAPIAYFSSRNSTTNISMGFRSFFWLFMATLFGMVGNPITYFWGLKLSSPTVASTTVNLIPAVTFVLASIVGLEKIDIRSLRTIAKIGGTIVCVGGAISVALIKGPRLFNLESVPVNSSFGIGGDDTWLIGCLLLFVSNFLWSAWLIIQGIVYGVSVFLQSWCISQRGPVFAAMFNPLITVIVSIFAAIFLNDQIYAGSLAGAVAVITGLYIVLWGKAEDIKAIKQEEADPEMQNDQRSTRQGPSNVSSEREAVNDLKEPLISDRSVFSSKGNMN